MIKWKISNSVNLKWNTANWLPNQISPELLQSTRRYHAKTLKTESEQKAKLSVKVGTHEGTSPCD